MKRCIEVRLALNLLVDAALDENDIATYVRASLPLAFDKALTALKNPVDILDVREVRNDQP